MLPRAMQLYQLMRLGSAVLTGILLAKTALSTAEIGTWEALLFIGSVVVFTGVNGLLQGISPLFTPMSQQRRKEFLFNVFLVFTWIGAGVFLLFLFGNQWFIPLLTGQSSIPGLYWFLLYLFLLTPSMPLEIGYLLQEKPVSIVLWGAFGFGLQTLAVFLPAWWGWGLTGSLQMLCVVGGLRLVWTLIWMFRYTRFQINLPDIRSYLSFSGPMVANSLTGNLIGFFDNWLVGFWFGSPAIFAIYRYGAREFPLALALSTALGTSMVPEMSANIENGMADLKQRTTRLLHVVMPLTILLLLFTPWLFPRVFNPSFAAAAPLFQVYLLITLSRVLLPNSVLVAMGETKIIFKVGLAELALKIILGFVLVNFWGLYGLAWSMVIGCWFEKAALIYYLSRYKSISPEKWLPTKVFLIYAAVLLLVFAWSVGQ